MTALAVTGHMDLTEESVPLVRAALRDLLAPYGPGLTGVSCVAVGADTIFAEEVTAAGGRLVVVIPSLDYREAKVKPDHAPVFDLLVSAAAEVVTLAHPTANRAAYEAANAELLRRADRLVAVWDGSPPAGRGGTADTVAGARAAGVPVDVVWPESAARRG
ncbi:hypothetical protein [Streptomyces clavuligerus]|uniref:DUF1273 domain-containing protein n=1 Tax=Streptomyces clavuligerus TaxID=1901 RepID=E2Q026_STRCL|nr:hypothetical protein [Streptomyces clavuligerus]ANW18860.1 hypothetical protein BB341_11780 [Streptomyces clavuligerus]AXU13432.1 hypothetical protein D1794_12190 [Streptomyces clavuligerus]EFG08445.1 Hypothetical protein SCLAV_3374 [Streptomyces clavuligerus]MBY6303392.1 hypothetical protein [Streptomyces clavuligerus]QCS06215.1 hypothetical protein CRV15_11620 [Streptomyces clavuligerus]